MRLTKTQNKSFIKFIRQSGMFLELLCGTSITDAAERNGLSHKAASQYFAMLRKIIAHDCGPFRGHTSGTNLFDKYPPHDDPLWPALYKCTFECPTNRITEIEKEGIDTRFTINLDKIDTKPKQDEFKKLRRCDDCPFSIPVELNFTRLYMQQFIKRGIIINENNFHEYYLMSRLDTYIKYAQYSAKFREEIPRSETHFAMILNHQLIYFVKNHGLEGVLTKEDMKDLAEVFAKYA